MLEEFFPSLKMIESPLMTIIENKVVKRCWKERLWSWPWTPWKTEKTLQIIKPDPNVFMIGKNTVIGHPATIRILRNELQGSGVVKGPFVGKWEPSSKG